MDIPEVRRLIGHHLGVQSERSTNHALASCARVCKKWNETFIPLLYGDFHTRQFSKCTPGTRRLESLNAGLHRHGHLMTKLSVTLPYLFLNALATSTGNIKKLSIIEISEIDVRPSTLGDEDGMRTLLTNNSRIDYLELEHFNGANGSRYIVQIAQYCLQLKYLSVFSSTFDLADLAFLREFQYLSGVRFVRCHIVATGGPLIRAPSLPGLKLLVLDGLEVPAMATAVEFISNCPHLERLDLRSTDKLVTKSQIHHSLWKFQPPPKLWCLCLVSIDLNDQDLARVLDGCPALTKLVLQKQKVGTASLVSLVNLAENLTCLRISHEKDFGYWKRRLLCALPKLVDFRCSNIDVDELFYDTMEEEPWSKKKQERKKEWAGSNTGDNSGPDTKYEPGPSQPKEHLLGRWVCAGLKNFRTSSLILSLDTNRNQALMDQLRSLQSLSNFVALAAFRRVLDTQAADYNRYSRAKAESPRMDRATKILVTGGVLSRYDLLHDPKLRWIPTMWPKIQSYQGPEDVSIINGGVYIFEPKKNR